MTDYINGETLPDRELVYRWSINRCYKCAIIVSQWCHPERRMRWTHKTKTYHPPSILDF